MKRSFSTARFDAECMADRCRLYFNALKRIGKPTSHMRLRILQYLEQFFGDVVKQEWDEVADQAARSLTSADIKALRAVGLHIFDIDSIRPERRTAVQRDRPSKVSVIVPKSRAEAQLMNYFKKQDYIEGYNDWPEQMRRLAIRAVKDDRSRFLLAVYYALHGLSPELSRDFILASGVKDGELVRGPYNDHQLQHLERVFAMLEKPGFLDRYARPTERPVFA